MLYRIPAFQRFCKQEREEAKEVKKRHEYEIRERDEQMKLLRRKHLDLEQELNESRTSRESIVSENASLKDTMSVEQEKRKQSEKAMTENEEKTKQVMDMYKQREVELDEKLKSKDLRIETLAENLQRTEKTTSLKVKRLVTENEETTKKLEYKEQCVHSLTEMLEENERNETALRQQVEELNKGREGDRARAEEEKRSLAADMTKKLESKQQRVDTLTEIVGGKERNETTLRQQVEKLKKGREGDRARAEEEKRSLAADMTKKLESKQQHVDTLTEIVGEKEQDNTTLKQQVEEIKTGKEEERARFEKEKQSTDLHSKKEHDDKEQLMWQLKRETRRLRTKILLESEKRSAEQKTKAETPQRSLISWMTSGKKAQYGTSSSVDNLTEVLGRSDTLPAGEEPPDDEFAKILKQIADDLTDEASIDSLGGQLGILQGDIERALKTNVKFNRVTSDGTRHMLKQWRISVSRQDERMQLNNALQAAKLISLADQYLSEGRTATKTVATTITRAPVTSTVATVAAASGAANLPIHDGSQSAGVPMLSRMNSEVNPKFDSTMKKIAEALHTNSDIDDLGSALGFEYASIGRHIQANAQQGMNYMGTVDMLRTWRKRQTGSTEQSALRSALLRAGFVNLADQHLSPSNLEAGGGGAGPEQPQKMKDSHQLPGIDSTPSAQGSSGGQTKARETTAATDQPQLHDQSSKNQGDEPSERMDQLSEQLSTQSTDGVQGISEDKPFGGLTGLEHPQKIGEAPGSSGEQDKTNKPTTTIHQALDDTSPTNQMEEAIEGMDQHSEESSINNIADDVRETSVDVSSNEPFAEGTSTSDERSLEDITINYSDLLSNLALTETSSEKLLMICLLKAIIDIPLKAFGG